jgi:hypothetical protein
MVIGPGTVATGVATGRATVVMAATVTEDPDTAGMVAEQRLADPVRAAREGLLAGRAVVPVGPEGHGDKNIGLMVTAVNSWRCVG